jgi:hypothetical protein
LSIKTRLLAGASTLAIAGGMIAFAAPAANATVTSVGGCSGTRLIGKAKSSTINPATGKPYGISDNDNQDATISLKGVDPSLNKGPNLGACVFATGLSTPDSSKPVVKGYSGGHSIYKFSGKLYSPEIDCNTADTGDLTEWPASGSFKMKFADLTTAGKNQQTAIQLVVDGFADHDMDPMTPSDIVEGHGIVTKGVAAGADVAFESIFDPIAKDKTQTTATPYFGYNYDVAAAVGCTDATPDNADILLLAGGDSGTSLLGDTASGFTFTVGQP